MKKRRAVSRPHAKTPAAPRRSRPTSKKPSTAASRREAIEAVPVTAEELRILQRELQRRIGERKSATGRQPRASGSRTSGSRTKSARAKSAAATRRPAATPLRWNPDPADVQKSVAQLVLTIVEFLRKLMERQAIRRMEAKTLTPQEVEAVGAALMLLEETVRDIGSRFGLLPEDLNLDLGPIKLM